MIHAYQQEFILLRLQRLLPAELLTVGNFPTIFALPPTWVDELPEWYGQVDISGR